MNYFKNNRWVFWTIGLLVLLNMSTLALLWMQHERPSRSDNHGEKMEHHKEKDPEKSKKRIAKALDLNEEQIEQFYIIMSTHKKETRARFDLIREKKQSKMEALTASPSDTAVVATIDKELAALNIEMETSLNQHYHKLSALCTTDQKEKLKEFFKKRMRKHDRKRKR